ncbi:MAG: hypothetical protein P4L83_17830 [Nevskia sp.]|nr:hypothetical protein [Nevskia sp.]
MDYAGLLRRYDGNLKDAGRELRRAPDSAAAREAVALAWLQRAQLSGDFRDYAAADRTLASAFAAADELHAPLPSRIQLDLLLHRLPQAQLDLAQLNRRYLARGSPQFIADEAELAFQQGHYADALDGFHRALRLEEGLVTLVRLAVWYGRTGRYSEAAALLDRAASQGHSDTPYLPAWLQVQQGMLLFDRGRWEQADECFAQAEALLHGWWLPRSRHAAVLALLGRREQATGLYQALAAETGDPEFLDAVARLRREGPDPTSAADWIARAAAAHAQRLQLLPEAAYAHAAEHELWFGQPLQALELARRNAQLRPNGEARVLLAEALFKAGRAAEAKQEIEAVRATAWNTAELHAIAAQIAAGLGRRETAEAERAQALDLNPRAFRMYLLPQPPQPETLP